MVLPLKTNAGTQRAESPLGDEIPCGQQAPDPEVSSTGKRRYHTAAYKAKILKQADACTGPGALGALLRREGLYSSHLTNWRKKQAAGLAEQKRGRKKDPATAERHENTRQQREIERLTEKLRYAELIIEVQKKVAALLGNPLVETKDVPK